MCCRVPHDRTLTECSVWTKQPAGLDAGSKIRLTFASMGRVECARRVGVEMEDGSWYRRFVSLRLLMLRRRRFGVSLSRLTYCRYLGLLGGSGLPLHVLAQVAPDADSVSDALTNVCAGAATRRSRLDVSIVQLSVFSHSAQSCAGHRP